MSTMMKLLNRSVCAGAVLRLGLRFYQAASNVRRSYYHVPTVYEKSSGYNLYLMFYSRRIVFVNGVIYDDVADAVTALLLYLDSRNRPEPIHMYLNSLGGCISAGICISDTMQLVRSPIMTLCMGRVESIASLLLAAGAKGTRRALPHASIMMHQPHGGCDGTATDLVIHAQELLRNYGCLNALYAKHTGAPINEVQKCMDRECFMTAEEAKCLGLIDSIVD